MIFQYFFVIVVAVYVIHQFNTLDPLVLWKGDGIKIELAHAKMEMVNILRYLLILGYRNRLWFKPISEKFEVANFLWDKAEEITRHGQNFCLVT